MSVGYYISLERPIQGLDPLSVDGKALAIAHFESQSTKDYLVSPFAALDEVFSVNSSDALAFAESEGIDLEGVEPPPIKWIAADTGFKIISELLAKLRDPNGSVPLPDSLRFSCEEIVADLEGIAAVLRAAEKEGVRFYLTCDTP